MSVASRMHSLTRRGTWGMPLFRIKSDIGRHFSIGPNTKKNIQYLYLFHKNFNKTVNNETVFASFFVSIVSPSVLVYMCVFTNLSNWWRSSNRLFSSTPTTYTLLPCISTPPVSYIETDDFASFQQFDTNTTTLCATLCAHKYNITSATNQTHTKAPVPEPGGKPAGPGVVYMK